jgi:spore coat protein U-like protein
MKHSVKLIAAACLLGMAGMAQAADVTDQFQVTVIVGASCELQPVQDIIMTVPSGSQVATRNAMFNVSCSDQLPYTLELNTQAGGALDVTDSNTNRTYQVKFKQSMTNAPWGSVANGEAYSGVGAGLWQNIPYRVTFNQDMAYGMPQVGVYENPAYTATLSFF